MNALFEDLSLQQKHQHAIKMGFNWNQVANLENKLKRIYKEDDKSMFNDKYKNALWKNIIKASPKEYDPNDLEELKTLDSQLK